MALVKEEAISFSQVHQNLYIIYECKIYLLVCPCWLPAVHWQQWPEDQDPGEAKVQVPGQHFILLQLKSRYAGKDKLYTKLQSAIYIAKLKRRQRRFVFWIHALPSPSVPSMSVTAARHPGLLHLDLTRVASFTDADVTRSDLQRRTVVEIPPPKVGVFLQAAGDPGSWWQLPADRHLDGPDRQEPQPAGQSRHQRMLQVTRCRSLQSINSYSGSQREAYLRLQKCAKVWSKFEKSEIYLQSCILRSLFSWKQISNSSWKSYI